MQPDLKIIPYYEAELYIGVARSNLLRVNKGRVRAFHEVGIGSLAECVYQYNSGRICAASAALTDFERWHIFESRQRSQYPRPCTLNHCSISTLNQDWGFFDPREREALQILQDKHDNVLRTGQDFDDFNELYDLLSGRS